MDIVDKHAWSFACLDCGANRWFNPISNKRLCGPIKLKILLVCLRDQAYTRIVLRHTLYVRDLRYASILASIP